MPRFSVVIPLYNKASYISKAIDSVLSQKLTDFELLVVNDGSMDGGEMIVATYSDSRIRLINQSNGGVSAARNKGIAESVASYVAFLDADDTWDADFLEIIEQLVRDFPMAGAYAAHIRDSQSKKQHNSRFYDPGRCKTSRMIENYFEDLNAGYFPFTPSSVCVKKSVLNDINRFDLSLKIGEDIDTWIRIFLISGIALSNRFAAIYHTDADNRSIHRPDFSQRELEFFDHLRKRYLNPSLERRSYGALFAFTSRRIHQIVIRSIYQGNKRFAAKVLREHWLAMTGRQRVVGITRLCTPNALVEFLKRIKGGAR